jgi:hypothetical protein
MNEWMNIFVSAENFLILKWAKNHKGLSELNKVDGTFM